MLKQTTDSHFSAQYGNGIVGALKINGPASLPYDVDLDPLILSDYYYRTADEIVAAGGAPPSSDNVLYAKPSDFVETRSD